ncbi:MAG: rod shape-determining protein MreC, partial [Patescibacteria group bacterium]
MRWRYFVIILIIFLTGITYFTAFFIKKERSFDENARLKQENEELRAQIQKFSIFNSKLEIPRENFFAIKVFSTYPFNIKNQISINAGEKQGIKISAPVILGKDILVGQVIEVFENYSVVKTIFDPNWQLPVRIGKDEINGLFQGGGEPKINLIDKEKPVQAGDI